MYPSTTYLFPHYQLLYNELRAEVITKYADGASCRVWAIREDEEHGKALGITGAQHKLLHEIVHQLLAISMGASTCPIVRCQALMQPMPANAAHLEEMIMALSYMAMKAPMPFEDWWTRIHRVQVFCNPYKLTDNIFSVFEARKVYKTIIVHR